MSLPGEVFPSKKKLPPIKNGAKSKLVPPTKTNAFEMPDIEIEEVGPSSSTTGNGSGTSSGWWWKRRSALEKLLLFITALLLMAIILLMLGATLWYRTQDALANNYAHPVQRLPICTLDDSDTSTPSCCSAYTTPRIIAEPSTPLCVSKDCVMVAHRLLTHSDQDTDPCQNFFQHACGGWQDQVELPPDQLYHAINLNELRDKVHRQIKGLLEAPKKDGELQAFHKLKDFYSSCIHSANFTDNAHHKVLGMLEDLGGYKSQTEWDEWVQKHPWNLSDFLIRLLRVNGAPLFDVTLDIDVTNNTRFALLLGLPRQYGLIPALLRSRRESLADRMVWDNLKMAEIIKKYRPDIKTRRVARPQRRLPNPSRRPNLRVSESPLGPSRDEEYEEVEEEKKVEDEDAQKMDEKNQSKEYNTSGDDLRSSNTSSKDDSNGTSSGISRKKLYNLLSESVQRQKQAELEKQIVAFAQLHKVPPDQFRREMKRILAMAAALQQIVPGPRQRKLWEQHNKIYNAFTLDEVQRKYNFMQWKPFLEELMGVNLTGSEPVYISYPDYFRRLSLLVKFSDPRTLYNTMLALYGRDVLQELSPVPPTQLHQQVGEERVGERWTFCVQATSAGFGEALSGLYLQYFSAQKLANTRKQMEVLFERVRASIVEGMSEVEWMDDDTRAEAVRKVKTLRANLVAPDFYNDPEYLEETMSQVEIHSTDFFNNVMQMYRLFRRQLYQLYREPVEEATVTWAFITFPFVVNAFYIQQFNSIVVPMALLEEPHFAPGLPSYLNFGAMGSTLAHEVLHGFDGAGHAFDASGVMREWWSPEAKRRFLRDSACLADHFSSSSSSTGPFFSAREVMYEGRKVHLSFDGNFTLNENTADLGGLKYALRAFRAFEAENGLQPLLPGVNMTTTQLFFLSTAQAYCSVMSPMAYVFLLELDEHTPHPERVNGMLMNSPEFAEAFQCPVGSPMNPEREKCTLW